ncbi:hypothetical protein DPMN_100041 [Dreissena polymorpha]|uniref:Uncharacterized protein n=1 Tax=Dreissena polymorpha TaxID=45954 RepID=A0A9D4LGL1_DREPO|nr:hypothetical protein DPMN_100041 [Dreissena polymorpha]
MSTNDKNKKTNGANEGGGKSKSEQNCQSNQSSSQNSSECSASAHINPYTDAHCMFYHHPGVPPTFKQPVPPPFPTYQAYDMSIYELFKEMNVRLKAIETNVSKITPIERDLTYLRAQMSEIREESKSTSKRIYDIETFCSTFSDITDDIFNSRKCIEDELSSVKQHNSWLENQIHILTKQKYSLHKQCLGNQTRHMEKNLIVFGIEEARNGNSRENTEQTLRAALTEHLQENRNINTNNVIDIRALTFSRVYRVGNPAKAAQSNRPARLLCNLKNWQTETQSQKSRYFTQ